MNELNHFAGSIIVLSLLFPYNSLAEIVFFSVLFGVAIDLNQILGRMLKHPQQHRRTWIEEPLGLVLFGVPMGFAMSLISREYLFLTLVPYALHIILDYLTIHEVSPLAPVSDRKFKTGIFRPVPRPAWFIGERGVSEIYVLGALTVVLLFII